MQSIKIAIADDHKLVLEGVKRILQDASNEDYRYTIIGTANDGLQTMSMLRKVRPDILLLDLNMPEMDGLEVLNETKNWHYSFKVIILTMYRDSKMVKAVFKSGADGYVLKDFGQEELLAAIEDVWNGKTFIGQGVEIIGQEGTLVHEQYNDKFIRKHSLTRRELEILHLITQALSNKEIAKELYISDQTVSVHRKNIMRKLGVSNTAGLIKMAYDNSLV